MDILNSASFQDMLEKCSDASGYRGLIVFNECHGLKEFIKEFVSLNKASPIPGIRIIKQRWNSGSIEFSNDSIIHLILSNTSARGYRCNTILYDETISDEGMAKLNRYIIPYKTPHWESDNGWTREFFCKWVLDDKLFEVDPMENVTDTEELDNFLNEFKIASKK